MIEDDVEDVSRCINVLYAASVDLVEEVDLVETVEVDKGRKPSVGLSRLGSGLGKSELVSLMSGKKPIHCLGNGGGSRVSPNAVVGVDIVVVVVSIVDVSSVPTLTV